MLPINQNTALFSLLGTTYGGDGQSTFGLPDLRGRAALGMGQGSGLQPYLLGQPGGVEFGHADCQSVRRPHARASGGGGGDDRDAGFGRRSRHAQRRRRRFTPPPGRQPNWSAARSRPPRAAAAHMRIGSRAWRSTTSSRSLEFFRRRTDELAASRQERNRWQIPFSARSRCFRTTLPHLDGPFARANCCRSARTRRFSLCSARTFGGNGTTNFQLPDLRGRVPIGQGQGPGLSNYNMGGVQGAEAVTLTTATTPAHSHGFLSVRGCRDHQCAERRLACPSARQRARRRLCH